MERYILANLEREFGGVKPMNNIEILEDKKEMFIDTLYESYRQSEVKPFEKALENLIKENKELKDKCKELNFKYTAQWVDDNFIAKSKVKEKIEELQEEFEYLGNNNKRVNKMTIEILQELLKGE